MLLFGKEIADFEQSYNFKIISLASISFVPFMNVFVIHMTRFTVSVDWSVLDISLTTNVMFPFYLGNYSVSAMG